MQTKAPETICPSCHTGHEVGITCPICGYPRESRHPIRAVVISILFCATGIAGYLLAPLYVRWIGQKGNWSIVTFPVEILTPGGLWPKLAAIGGAGWVAFHFGTLWFGNDPLGWIVASYLFIDIPIRLAVVPVHLYRYLRSV